MDLALQRLRRGPHDSGIDEAVAAEGVVSILGVPMLAEDTVLGVLFAATRHERAFGAEEIALLSALADHASVVMQTAGILKQLKDSEENTQRALARLQDHVAARDRSNVVHQKLVAAVLTAGVSARWRPLWPRRWGARWPSSMPTPLGGCRRRGGGRAAAV